MYQLSLYDLDGRKIIANDCEEGRAKPYVVVAAYDRESGTVQQIKMDAATARDLGTRLIGYAALCEVQR